MRLSIRTNHLSLLKDIHGQKSVINRADIVKAVTRHGITDITLKSGNDEAKVVYVMLNDSLFQKCFEPIADSGTQG